MRRLIPLLAALLALAPNAFAQGPARWSADDIVRAFGQPSSAVRTADGGALISYDNLAARQFASDAIYRRYAATLLKHTTASLRFALDGAMRCTGASLAFDDPPLESPVLNNDPAAAARLHADLSAALAARFAGKCS